MQIIHVLDDGGVITYITEDMYQALKHAGGAPFDAFLEEPYNMAYLRDEVRVRDYIQALQTQANIMRAGAVSRWVHRTQLEEARQFISDAIEPYQEGDDR